MKTVDIEEFQILLSLHSLIPNNNNDITGK
jgi:hypothetical protein